MAGNRTSGILGISANFEPQISAAFDARTNVPTRDDLINAATWVANDGGTYIFNGMTVTVAEDSTPAQNGVYILLDAANVTNLASWLFVGSASGSAITVQDEGVTLTSDVQQFNFTGGGVTATAVGNNVTVNIPVGGEIYYGGDGIDIDTTTTGGPFINVDLYTAGCVATHGANLEFVSNKLNFKGVHVQQDGTDVGTYPVINFTGADVLAQQSGGDSCVVDVFVPQPTFAPYFNQASTTRMTCSKTFYDLRISQPTTEGNPFKTNGWAGTFNASYEGDPTTGLLSFNIASNNQCTGFGGDSTMTVVVYDADGTTVLATHTTSAIAANGSYGNGSTITVDITNYATDTTKFKATPTVGIQIQNIITGGGRFHVQISHTTDTNTDSGTTYNFFGPNQTALVASQTYTAATQDVFLDVNNLNSFPSTPQINGTTTIQENVAAIQSKHLSGVEYYMPNSQFEVDTTDIDDYNANTQGRSLVGNTYNFYATGVNYNLPNLQIKAWSPSPYGTFSAGSGTWPDGYNAQDVDWDYDNWAISNSNWRFRNTNGTVNAQVFDGWDAGNTVASSGASILVDTYAETGNSSKLAETFIDEEFRLVKGATSYTGWTTTSALSNSVTGNAVTSTGVSTGPFSDMCTVGSNIVRADKFFKDNGSSGNTPSGGYNNLTGSLVSYKPNGGSGGPNPNPDYSGFTNTPVYHRLFEVSSSNFNRPIASFELGFKGSFPTTGNVFDELTNNNLIVYIRKKECATTGVNIEAGAIPHSLHNGNMSGANAQFNAAYANPPTSVDAADGSAQCRTTASAPTISGGYYVIAGSFGQPTQQCLDGFYIEVHYQNASIRIDDIKCKVNFAAGTPTTEGSSS